MKEDSQALNTKNPDFEEKELEGVYGSYRITLQDAIEVKYYRLALLTCGISLVAGLVQWLLLHSNWAVLWIIPLSISLGLVLNWIHIYLEPLHRLLQALWLTGTIGILWLSIKVGVTNLLPSLEVQPLLVLVIGPFFAALTGVGFKEFFCFRRPEAIGLTLLIPMALIGHLSQFLNHALTSGMLFTAALLLLILSIRKFGMDAASDIGDKSIFDYLAQKKSANAS